MMPRLIYIISILLSTTFWANAQDSTEVKQEKLALVINADYGKGIESLLGKQTKWEFGLGLVIKNKVAFNFEYGYGLLSPQSVINNGNYSSEGSYYRAGAEYVLTITSNRYLSFGGMFAASSFKDEGSVTIISELWPSITETFERQNLSANWIEATLNSEGPVFRVNSGFLTNFYWGIRARVRIMITDLSRDDFEIYAVPGFGKTYSTVVPAVNFFLKYRIEF